MKSVLRATAILSGSSIISILLSLVSAKVMALYLQPAGYGYYGLLQSFVSVASLITGMGVSTAMVRMGAGAVTRDDAAAISSLRNAAWLLFAGISASSLMVLAVFRAPISQWALGTREQSASILWMGLALLFTVGSNLQTGVLNAYHRVTALAMLGVLNTMLTAAIAIPSVMIWRIHGVIPAVIGGPMLGCVVSAYVLHRVIGPVPLRTDWRTTLKAARSLLAFGGPYTASMIVGTGVQLALPMVILHLLDTESVGYYRAAAAISVGYLGFLVTAMGQDYYPRVSAAAGQPETLVRLINEQHRLVMLLAAPVILATLALVPYLVPLVYSSKFHASSEILEWQLIGDLFKFSSWTMAFAILARCKSSVYFFTESIAGIASLATTWLAVRWFGLSGVGIGFLATYVIYYFVVWIVIRREIQLVWTRGNQILMAAGVSMVLLIRILPSTPLAGFRTVIALSLALVAGLWSLYSIWQEMGSLPGFDMLRRITQRI
jgi:PST family polysaccharide transporter